MTLKTNDSIQLAYIFTNYKWDNWTNEKLLANFSDFSIISYLEENHIYVNVMQFIEKSVRHT